MVSGLPRETACLNSVVGEPREFKTAAGVGPKRAEKAARAFVDAGADALMSFGLAGGLSPAVPAGTIVLATRIVDGQTIYPVDEAWLSRIEVTLNKFGPFVKGPIVGVDVLLSSPKKKESLHYLTKALACDMESHAVARIAALNEIPFVSIRAVSDPHNRYVPDWVTGCLTSVGDVRLGLLIWELARRPFSLGDIIGLSRDARMAFDSLRSVAFCLGPQLRF